MPTLGIPTPTKYLLGRGELFLATDLDAAGRPKGYRSLGNAEAFTVTVETEKLEHFAHLVGLSTKDRDVVISQEMNLAFQLTELDADNMALFMAAPSPAGAAQTGAAVNATAAQTNVKNVKKGQWFDLYTIAAPTEYPPIGGTRAYRVTSVTVKDSTDTTTHALGVDYDVDAEMGRIFIISGGGIADGVGLVVDFTYATLTKTDVKALTQSAVAGVLKFISRNANLSGNGSQVEYTFWSVSLSADGDLALIGDEWATLNVAGSAGKNTVISSDSPTLTIRELSA
jgi:hypothetical protein